MEHPINVDGQRRIIHIRAMDEDFVVYRKMYQHPLTPENIGRINPGDWAEHLEEFKAKGWQAVIDSFFRLHIRTIGSCAILAWDGDGVIGKMYFTTKEMWEAFRQVDAWLCVEHRSMPATIQSFSPEQLRRLLDSPSRTLRILCFNIGHSDARYHGKGIARAMIDFLKRWALDRGWHKLEAESVHDVVPGVMLGGHILRRSAWERQEFHVAQQATVPPTEAAGRRDAIERILSGRLWPAEHWYMRSGRQNIAKVKALAGNTPWREHYDKTYVMAVDLREAQGPRDN